MTEWIDGIKYRDGAAVEAKKDITEASIKEGTTGIGSSAFAHCRRLSQVRLPEGLLSIGRQAFAGCENLTAIDLPESLRCAQAGEL